MMRELSLFLLFFFVCCSCFIAAEAASDAVPTSAPPEAQSAVLPEIQSASVGVEGLYKNGLWTPVTVQWQLGIAARDDTAKDEGDNNLYMLHADTVDGDGTPIRYSTPVTWNPTEKTSKSTILVKLGRSTEELRLCIEKNGQAVGTVITKRPSGDVNANQKLPAQQRFLEPIPSERPVYLVIGKEDIGLQAAIVSRSLSESQRPVVVKVSHFADFPSDAFALETVDTIFLTTTEPEQFAGMTCDSSQIKALEKWLRMGGRLVFCAGRDSEPLLRGDHAPLRVFLPGKFQEMTELRDGTALSAFSGSQRPIVMNGTAESPYLRFPYFTEPKGIALLKDKDLPLVLRASFGFGTLIFFAGDLSDRPLSNWRDRSLLVRRIMQWESDASSAVKPLPGLQMGYSDITGQIRSALDRFDGVHILPFSVILVILALFWLFIGPLDWLLVHKVLHRPILTWVTFPLCIILFCVLAMVLAIPGRPHTVLLNEFVLVDIDAETHSIRSSIWATLYSPNDATYSVALSAPVADSTGCEEDVRFAWNGLPGSGLGGMAPRTVSPTVWRTGSQHRGDTMDDVPVAVRSTKSFFGQCVIDKFNVENLGTENPRGRAVGGKIADVDGLPVGTITLRDLPPLNNAVLVYGNWLQVLGDVKPHQKIRLDRHTPRHEFRDLLLPPQLRNEETLRSFATYNTLSGERPYIGAVLSFHQALGGVGTIGLGNTFQRNLDLSELLTTDRAVLLGTLAADAAPFGPELTLDDGEGNKIDATHDISKKRDVLCRIVLPIELSTASPRLRMERFQIKQENDVLRGSDQDDGAVERIERLSGGQ